MPYRIMVLAPRKSGLTHSDFQRRYEQHMVMVAGLCGDAAPLSHTRWYPHHDTTSDKPVLLAGDVEKDACPSVIVLMEFEDEAAFGRFHEALLSEEANRRILEDEEGFWEREGMMCFAVGEERRWGD